MLSLHKFLLRLDNQFGSAKTNFLVNGRKELANILWLYSSRVFKLFVGAIVGVWLARYLGPESYGLLNYVVALVGLFLSFSSLGLKPIVIQNLVKDPESKEKTIGTATLLLFLGAIIAYSALLVLVFYLHSDNVFERQIICVFGLIIFFRVSDTCRFWFEAQLQSKRTVITEGIAFTIVSVLKVIFILSESTLVYFVFLILAESVLAAILIVRVFIKQKNQFGTLNVSFPIAKSLIDRSWPLIIWVLSASAFNRIDQIMIGQILGQTQLGYYSAAVLISEMWYFVALATTASLMPAFHRLYERSEKEFDLKLQVLFRVMVIISLPITLLVVIFSDWIILTIFGEAFNLSASVLSIHALASVFVFLGQASFCWFIVKNKQKLVSVMTLMGLILNIMLNVLFIPEYGIYGAAWATFLSRVFVALLGNLFFRETRILFKMMIKSLLVFGRS